MHPMARFSTSQCLPIRAARRDDPAWLLLRPRSGVHASSDVPAPVPIMIKQYGSIPHLPPRLYRRGKTKLLKGDFSGGNADVDAAEKIGPSVYAQQ
jgi:hypothetical protein